MYMVLFSGPPIWYPSLFFLFFCILWHDFCILYSVIKKYIIMDAARAKEFIYRPITDNRIYISKSLDRIMEIDNDAKRLIDVFGVVDTPNGEKMFEMDFSYGNEPILMRVLVHKEFFMQTYKERELINLDK